MFVRRLSIKDWRSWREAIFEPSSEGITVLWGQNGQGKTNILEAICWAATSESFRGSPKEALIRAGTQSAIIRLETSWSARRVDIEAELNLNSRSRVLINKQPLRRRADLYEALRISVFSPDDLVLVKGGPAERRRYLDEALVSLNPTFDSLRLDLDRVLRQRGVLLRQAGGRLTAEVSSTLDVWDSQLARIGEQVALRREEVVADLTPQITSAYQRLSSREEVPKISYQRSWDGDLERALLDARSDDVRRSRTGVGPHRDELDISIGGMLARVQASQGEQRSIALAMRLGTHNCVAQKLNTAPVLILDDVFSELDESRATSLLTLVPQGQVIVASAGPLPAAIEPYQIIEVDGGMLKYRPSYTNRSA